jgi:phosphoglycerate dehydrogenase-like enzyme
MIVLLETIHPDGEDILRAVDDVVLAPSPTALPDVPPAGIVALITRGLGRVPAALIDSLPSLRVVARCGAGVDNIDTAAAAARGVTVVYAPGVTRHAVAEHAMMLALCLARQTVRVATATSRGEWAVRDGFVGAELRGRRMGVVGLGSIGSRVAALGVAFEMQVIAWSRRARPDSPIAQVGLDELIATSDVIQLCLALTGDTDGMIDASRLSTVRPGALLVNTARGGIVDLSAVQAALETGRLGGYAADVWDPEPPPLDAPLLGDPRVIVTPHVAALTDTTYRSLSVGPAETVAAILRGQTPDARFVFPTR